MLGFSGRLGQGRWAVLRVGAMTCAKTRAAERNPGQRHRFAVGEFDADGYGYSRAEAVLAGGAGGVAKPQRSEARRGAG